MNWDSLFVPLHPTGRTRRLLRLRSCSRAAHLWIGACVLLASCSKHAAIQPLFEKLAPGQTNVHFENALEEEPLFNSINYLYFYDGGGVAAGDLDNDGLVDLYFTANQRANRLYRNRGDFRFEDVTDSAGVGGGTAGWTTGATMADVNGDGLLDIYVCRVNYLGRKGPNQLFINHGDWTFSEEAAAYGLAFAGLSRQAAFFDYDLDGDLDMYLLNHSVHTKATYGRIALRQTRDAEAGDRLFRNDGGRFTDVTAQAGIYSSKIGYGLGIAVGDINGDGYPDIYISNDFHEDDYLYYNNGDGTFTEAMRQSMGHVSSASMGNDLADFNNDGLLDLVVLDMLPEKENIRMTAVAADAPDIYATKLQFGYYHQLRRNTLQLNRGGAPGVRAAAKTSVVLFSEIGALAGVHATDWSWGPLFVDLDNDGWKDLFISNGIYRRPNDLDYLNYLQRGDVRMQVGGSAASRSPARIAMPNVHEITRHMPSVPEANHAFQSQRDLAFVNRAADWGLGDPGFTSGAVYADFDNDGAVDLAVNNTNSPAAIYRNLLYQPSGQVTRPAFLRVRLQGAGRNPFGLGARVVLHAGKKLFMQELMPTRGFQSAVAPVLYFGLGAINRLDSLEVFWPGGAYQVLKNVRPNRALVLAQRDATAARTSPHRSTGRPLFEEVTAQVQLDYAHRENAFSEYAREPLVPRLLSAEGPAFAVQDVDGDSLQDLYLGGARHRPGHIYLQNLRGDFTATADGVFTEDSLQEDVAAVFFDANGDARPDLYVVSGGNEDFGRAKPLRDRLYLNRGHGRFRRGAGLLPEIYANGSCAKPADVDADGDVDLFIGSRSLPWMYGMVPKSYLLINDGGGKFTDETAARAPAFSSLGMVTDAVWLDLNGDAFEDLVVVGDWMPVTVFYNQRGRLVDVTQKYGLEKSHGWWNTVAAADLNLDGRIDLVTGNLGLNAILKASPESPLKLFINDFSGNGRPEQILCYTRDGKLYPFVSLEQLFRTIPSLRETCPTYHGCAGKSVWDLFPTATLKRAAQRTTTELASAVLLNTGQESFEMIRLPAEAQFAPVRALLIRDFIGDGYPDILLGGNLYGVPPDQGRYDASYGSLLLGDGTGVFTPVRPQDSGFLVRGELRSLRTLRTAAGETLILAARNNGTVKIFRRAVPAQAGEED